jgi:hypothetical protein
VTNGERVAVDLLEPGWLLRVLSDDAKPRAEWLEIALVLHTQRAGLPNRVWVYLQDRATPLIYETGDVVHARQV